MKSIPPLALLMSSHIYADYLTNLSMYCIRGERCSTFLSKIFQHFSPNTDARNEDVYNYKFMDDVRAGNLSGMNATSYRNRNPMKSKEELKQQMSPKPTLYSSMTTGLSLSAEPASTTSPEQNNNSYMVDNLTYPNFDTLTTGQRYILPTLSHGLVTQGAPPPPPRPPPP